MKVEIEIPDGLHPDTQQLVAGFAAALGEKLKRSEDKYGYGNGWKTEEWSKELPVRLLEHAEKGDPRDVAAYCAFAWAREWSTKPGRTWAYARVLVRWIFSLCETDTDAASYICDKGGKDKPENCIVVVRDPEAARRLRLWLLASNYVTEGKYVCAEAQQNPEGV